MTRETQTEADVAADDAMLRGFLAGRDVPCPRCGYNLRDAIGGRCNECGTQVRLGVHALEPLLRAWIAATVAAALGAGVGLLFLVVTLKAGLPRAEFYFSCFGAWSCLPLLATLVAGRRRFIRRPPGVQWAIAVLIAFFLVAIVVGLRKVR